MPNSNSSDGSKPPRITWRALILGGLTIVAVFYYLILEVGQASGSGSYVRSQFPMVAFMPFVLWLFLNAACGRLWPRLALNRGELLTIFTMLWVVGALPQWGWSDYWIAIIGAPFYMATPENQWSDLLFPLFALARLSRLLASGARYLLDGAASGGSGAVGRLGQGDYPVAGGLAGDGGLRLLLGGAIPAPVDGSRKTLFPAGADAP